MPHNPYQNTTFDGIQDDEVILYVIHPHWLMFLLRLGNALMRLAVLLTLWFGLMFSAHTNTNYTQLTDFELRGYICAVIFFLLDFAWQFRFYSTYRGYITDRRIVVVKSVFPVTYKRLTLFWKDAVKARDIANSFLWRMLKIGTLEISARLFQGFNMQPDKNNPLGSEIQIKFVKNFVEIVNYIDNLIHLTAHHPEKIKDVRPLSF